MQMCLAWQTNRCHTASLVISLSSWAFCTWHVQKIDYFFSASLPGHVILPLPSAVGGTPVDFMQITDREEPKPVEPGCLFGLALRERFAFRFWSHKTRDWRQWTKFGSISDVSAPVGPLDGHSFNFHTDWWVAFRSLPSLPLLYHRQREALCIKEICLYLWTLWCSSLSSSASTSFALLGLSTA